MNYQNSSSVSKRGGSRRGNRKSTPQRQPKGPSNPPNPGFVFQNKSHTILPPETPNDHKIQIQITTGGEMHPGTPTPTVCQDSQGTYAHWQVNGASPSPDYQMYEIDIPNDRLRELNMAREYIVETCIQKVERMNWGRFSSEEVTVAYWPPSVWLVQKEGVGRAESRERIVREQELWEAVGRFRTIVGYGEEFALVLRFML